MRMPAHQLVGDFLDDGVDVEPAGFYSKMGMKDNMEKQVAQFFGESVEVVVLDRLEYFVYFFDQHRLQRIEILLLVPWAAVGAPQRRHDFDKLLELLSGHIFNVGPPA